MSQLPSSALLLLPLALLGSPLPFARGDDGPRPGDWTVLDEPAAPGAWHPGLWLPMRDGERVLVGDALGRHAALHEVPGPRCVVTLTRLVRAAKDAPQLAWRDATLETAGGALRPLEGDEVWRGEAAGQQTLVNEHEGMTRVQIAFPALDPAVSEVTLRLPVVDGVPVLVRFLRVRELVAAAEAELAAWKEHIEASSMISAIQPYLECAAYRALRARGDALVAAILLRELARGEEQGDRDAVPRFLVLHVLAGTEWGRTQQVKDHGDAEVARAVLRRWRDLGHPSFPGASPHERR